LSLEKAGVFCFSQGKTSDVSVPIFK